jgi:hypothetical protein
MPSAIPRPWLRPVIILGLAAGVCAGLFLVGGAVAIAPDQDQNDLRRAVDGLGWAVAGLASALLAAAGLRAVTSLPALLRLLPVHVLDQVDGAWAWRPLGRSASRGLVLILALLVPPIVLAGVLLVPPFASPMANLVFGLALLAITEAPLAVALLAGARRDARQPRLLLGPPLVTLRSGEPAPVPPVTAVRVARCTGERFGLPGLGVELVCADGSRLPVAAGVFGCARLTAAAAALARRLDVPLHG